MTITQTDVRPHVADRIEPGAILVSSWGYDQTNVDFYMVTRTTKCSAWIVPMSHREDHQEGYAPTAGHATPLEPAFLSGWCECRHRVSNHSEYGCRGAYGDACECPELREVPNVPQMHRIKYAGTDSTCLSLTSYSSASLWDGWPRYASHYA